jgi:hypothetical protein
MKLKLAVNSVCEFQCLLHTDCTLFKAYLLKIGEAGIVSVCTNNNNRPIFISCICDILRRTDVKCTVKYFFTKYLGLLREGLPVPVAARSKA